jgi:hypothetical protein
MKKRQHEERKEELKDWMAGKRTWNKEHPVEAQKKRWANLLMKEKRLLSKRQVEELQAEKRRTKKRLRMERKVAREALWKKKVPAKPKRGLFRWLKDRYDHLIKTKLRAGR